MKINSDADLIACNINERALVTVEVENNESIRQRTEVCSSNLFDLKE
jgi:hypothetical protein